MITRSIASTYHLTPPGGNGRGKGQLVLLLLLLLLLILLLLFSSMVVRVVLGL